LCQIGHEVDPDAKGESYYEVAARVWWWNACHGFNGQGAPRAIEAIANRLDGKPAESVTVTNITQLSADEHAQQILDTLKRLKRNEESGDITVN
jgi:hypothetical protein